MSQADYILVIFQRPTARNATLWKIVSDRISAWQRSVLLFQFDHATDYIKIAKTDIRERNRRHIRESISELAGCN